MIPEFAIRTKADELAVDEGCYWDQRHADSIIRFTERFFRSQFIRGPVSLQQQQSEFLQSLYGWRRPNGNRRWRFANLHVPKKSFGKTLLCSCISFFELLGSGEPSPVVMSGAASRENAAMIFDELHYAIERSPFAKHAHTTPHIKRIKIPSLNAEYRALASGNKCHGYSCSLVVLDEVHSHVNSDLYFAMRYAIQSRANGLVILISTSGSDPNHFYHAIYEKSKRVLAGEDLDTTHYACVYEADPEGDPLDPEQWHKANPLLGSSWCPLDQFERDLKAAKAAGVGEWLNARRLLLNQWVRPEAESYLDVSDFGKHKAEPTDDELKGCAAAIGLDLSECGDPSSCTIGFRLKDGTYYFRSWGWVSEKGAEDRSRRVNLPRFNQWIEQGSLTLTRGDMIDSRLIKDHVLDLCRRYDVRRIHADPRGAYILCNELAEEGYETKRFPQTHRYFSGPMKEFSKAYADGKVKHDGSEWLKFCLGNVRVEVNRYDEIAPRRKSSPDFIDGGIATLLAYHGLLIEPTESAGVFWE